MDATSQQRATERLGELNKLMKLFVTHSGSNQQRLLQMSRILFDSRATDLGEEECGTLLKDFRRIAARLIPHAGPERRKLLNLATEFLGETTDGRAAAGEAVSQAAEPGTGIHHINPENDAPAAEALDPAGDEGIHD